MKRQLFIALLTAGLSVSLGWAQSSSQSQSSQSLADIARKLKAQQGQTTTTPKVFTNDDVKSSSGSGSAAGETSTASSASAENTEDSGVHDEKYFRRAYSELMGKKEIAQRELDVLQKKQQQNTVQYYSDPQKGLEQQYSREDISKNQQEIDKKNQEMAQIDQSLSDLQDQLRQAGGDPSWLQGNPVSIEPDVPKQELPAEGDKMTKDYWQAKFKATRDTLAHAEEAQKLVEDEINFLKARQVQEPAPDAQAEITSKLADRQTELDKATAVTDKAKQNLDDLQKAFDASGAPADWSAPE